MRRIRIVYVIVSMGSGRAGTELNLRTIMENLDPRRFEPRLVSVQDCSFVRENPSSLAVHCLNVNKMFTPRMWSATRHLGGLMKEWGADVVQTFAVEGHLVGGLAARRAGVPHVVSSRRDLGFSYTPRKKLFLKIANRFPSRFLANCQAVARTLSRIEGIDPSRFDVIYNGVPDAEGAGSGSSKIVVSVANLGPIKRLDTLIDAAPAVLRRQPDARFLLVGEGPERERLTARIRSAGLERSVRLTGSVPDVSRTLKEAAIGVLTSSSEGCSNALLEYMRSALPVVATEAGGNPELVADGENGYLIAVGDSGALAQRILQLLDEPERAASMGARGRAIWKERFSLSAMMRSYERYYETLVAGPTAASRS